MPEDTTYLTKKEIAERLRCTRQLKHSEQAHFINWPYRLAGRLRDGGTDSWRSLWPLCGEERFIRAKFSILRCPSQQ